MNRTRKLLILLALGFPLLWTSCSGGESPADSAMVVEPDSSVEAAIHDVRPSDSIASTMPELSPDEK